MSSPSVNSTRNASTFSPLWFFTGFFAVLLAGIAKSLFADYCDAHR